MSPVRTGKRCICKGRSIAHQAVLFCFSYRKSLWISNKRTKKYRTAAERNNVAEASSLIHEGFRELKRA